MAGFLDSRGEWRLAGGDVTAAAASEPNEAILVLLGRRVLKDFFSDCDGT